MDTIMKTNRFPLFVLYSLGLIGLFSFSFADSHSTRININPEFKVTEFFTASHVLQCAVLQACTTENE